MRDARAPVPAVGRRHARRRPTTHRGRGTRIMSVVRLYLVRHGATQLTAEDRFSGAVGVDLSDDGRRQAERLGLRLADEGITAAYCSPLSRTVETARLIAERLGLSVETQDGLREISHGRWE